MNCTQENITGYKKKKDKNVTLVGKGQEKLMGIYSKN